MAEPNQELVEYLRKHALDPATLRENDLIALVDAAAGDGFPVRATGTFVSWDATSSTVSYGPAKTETEAVGVEGWESDGGAVYVRDDKPYRWFIGGQQFIVYAGVYADWLDSHRDK